VLVEFLKQEQEMREIPEQMDLMEKKNYVHKNLTRNKNKCQIFTKRTILLYGPGFDSASNRKEYKEYFLEVKAASA